MLMIARCPLHAAFVNVKPQPREEAVAAGFRSSDRHAGQVLVGGGSPNTTLPRVAGSMPGGLTKSIRKINILKKGPETTRTKRYLCPSHVRKISRHQCDGFSTVTKPSRCKHSSTAGVVASSSPLSLWCLHPRAIAASMVTIMSSAVTRLSLDFIATAA
jgi:hypothetical protein